MRRTKTDLARAAQAPPALSAVRPPSRRLFCELHRATIGTHPVLVCGRCLVRGAAARSRHPQVRAAATVVLGVVEAGAQKGWGEGGVGEGGGGEGDRGVFANASTNPPPPPPPNIPSRCALVAGRDVAAAGEWGGWTCCCCSRRRASAAAARAAAITITCAPPALPPAPPPLPPLPPRTNCGLWSSEQLP